MVEMPNGDIVLRLEDHEKIEAELFNLAIGHYEEGTLEYILIMLKRSSFAYFWTSETRGYLPIDHFDDIISSSSGYHVQLTVTGIPTQAPIDHIYFYRGCCPPTTYGCN